MNSSDVASVWFAAICVHTTLFMLTIPVVNPAALKGLAFLYIGLAIFNALRNWESTREIEKGD